MSSYRHKSGAQKRQGKKQWEQEVKRDSRTLFEVGAFRRERDQETSIESEESSVQRMEYPLLAAEDKAKAMTMLPICQESTMALNNM